ncbi:MAG: Ku protein [Acetobacteraceae bacterium]|nr:Ku protein [Acetobacteraceae bacterium]
MRPLWKGSISFGLVNIPVRLYAATERQAPHFTQLHDRCRTPLRHVRFCPRCEREVGLEEVVRGYQVDPGRFVVFSEEELRALPLPSGRTVEILDFVDLKEIDPVYFDRTYYLEPLEGGEKAYALLRRAMEGTGQAAVARVLIRSREALAGIRVFDGRVLALHLMFYAQEVRPVDELPRRWSEPEVDQRELDMAVALIGNLRAPFSPEKYRSRYREALSALVQRKLEGQELVEVEAREPARVVDLMEALRESVRQAEEKRSRAQA